MKKENFLTRLENKYSLAAQLGGEYKTITEFQIFNSLKNLPNLYMLAGSYTIEYPKASMQNAGHIEVAEPWGPTVTFKYKSKEPPTKSTVDGKEYWNTPSGGDAALTKKVETQLTTTLKDIYSIGTEYQGNGVYQVDITVKK